MKTLRPLWGRGQMISPQHFQQQVNQAAWQSECIARLGVMNPLGGLSASNLTPHC